jgi:hypothetical protein
MRSHFTRRITSRRRVLFLLAGLTLGATTVAVAVVPAQIAGAAGGTVTNCNDSGAGSLRAEVLAATSGETISFALSPSCSTITLTSGLIDIATSVTIKGPGATTLAVSGNSSSAAFQVESGVIATISGLTIEDGSSLGSLPDAGSIDNYGTLTVKRCTLSGNDGVEGTIYNDLSGTLTVRSSTLSGNQAAFGGGIFNYGTATVTGSTVSDNTGGIGAGGIFNGGGATLTVATSTVSGNTAQQPTIGPQFGNGGGIVNDGTATVSRSLLSDNSAANAGAGIYAGHGTATLIETTLSGNGNSELGGVDLAGGTVTATNSNFS